ncbi:hypothetical protein [uncultured Jatrophihabitans sp.]|uniref:hypothetical protein n=1 Tax=uncultured Jatrophihabitans sp. TaxID=1610747 RepID=UPI0035CA62C5
MRDDDDYDSGPAPGVVVAAVALGTVPVPFVAIYAVMFLVHGSVHPVVPPDITDSKNGEFIAGIIAAVIFAVELVALLWAMSGRRRWLFAVVQLAMLAASLDFAIDATKGGRTISIVVFLVCVAALVCVFWPQAWPYYRTAWPFGPDRPATPGLTALRRKRSPGSAGMPAGSAAVSDATPTTAPATPPRS